MYFDKRNKEGLIMSFDAFKTGKDISDFSFEKFKKSKIYNILIKNFCKKSIENYFKTFFYLKSFPVAHQINFADYLNFDQKKQKDLINLKYCENHFYVIKFLKEKKLSFSKKLTFKGEYNKIVKSLVCVKKFFNRLPLMFLNKIKQEKIKQNYKIGVSFKEGLDQNKRSDIFWFDKKKISTDDVLIYFESDYYKYRYEKREKSEPLELSEFNHFHLLNFFYDKKELVFNNIIKDIKNIKDNEENIFLGKLSIKLLKQIEFWYYFFKKFNIKIHFDSEEMNLNRLVKQIALRKLDSASIGRVRSYISKECYDFMGTLSADINFVNQRDSADRLENHSFNESENILIMGDTNNIFTNKNVEELDHIKKKISDSKRDFVILVLDSNFSENLNLDFDQIITTEYFEKYYNEIIQYVEKNQDTFLIIKPKKERYVTSKNEKVFSKILELEKKNKCYLVRDSFRKFPYLYASISNFIISTSSAFPSALIECVARGKKGIFCDYPNLSSVEKDIYKFDNYLIVKDLEDLKKILDEFKSKFPYTKIGDWSLINDMVEKFNDDKGHERAANFIANLLNEFKKNLSKNQAFNNAIDQYEKEFGKTNIFKRQ